MNLERYVNGEKPLGRANPVTNYTETRDSFVSLGIVKSGDLRLEWGASYTWPTGYIKIGSSVAATGSEPISGENIVDVLRSMAFKSTAWFFPNGTIRGSKPAGTPTKEQQMYGITSILGDTGVITENAEIGVKGMHLNIDYWNAIRANSTGYQVFLFMNNMVVWVQPKHVPKFHDLAGLVIGGDPLNSIDGGNFQLGYQSIGEIVPMDGVVFTHLDPFNFKFTFGTVTPTGLTIAACATGGLKLTGTAAAGGSFTRPILEAAFSDCVTYSLKILSGASNTGITIDATTGAVTVAAGTTAGTYNVRVLAQNNSSIYGFYDVVITLTA